MNRAALIARRDALIAEATESMAGDVAAANGLRLESEGLLRELRRDDLSIDETRDVIARCAANCLSWNALLSDSAARLRRATAATIELGKVVEELGAATAQEVN